MGANIPPPATVFNSMLGPPPTKIPRRDQQGPSEANNLPPIPRNRLQLASKSGPSSASSSVAIPEKPIPKITFVKEGQLDEINQAVQNTLKNIPLTFPPKPPVPQAKAIETLTESPIPEVVRPKPPSPPAPIGMMYREHPEQAPSHSIIIAPNFHPPSWNQPNWHQQPDHITWTGPNIAGIDPRIFNSQNLSSHIVFNQQGRPMLLLPLWFLYRKKNINEQY